MQQLDKELLVTLFEKSDAVLFRWNNDPLWSIDYVSSNVKNLLGYGVEEFYSGKITYAQSILPQDFSFVQQEVLEATLSNKDFFKHSPYRILTKTNEIKWVLDYTVAQKDKNNQITHYVGYILDITKTKENEENLQLSLERYKTLMNLSSDGIFIMNLDGKLLHYSKRARDFLGYDDMEMIRLHVYDWDKELATPKDFEKLIQNIGFKAVNVERIHTKKDGTTYVAAITATKIHLDGEVCLYASVRDITKEKKQEEKMKEQSEILSHFVLYSRTDTRGIITDVSEAFCKLSGYSRDEFIGKSHRILRHEDMPKSLYKELWETIKSGREWIGDIKNKTKSGNSYWVHSEMKPEFDEDGKIQGYVSIRTDITAKKYLELQQKFIQEQSKLASMGEMIGNIAHQWRQPLSAISIAATGMLFKKELGLLNGDEIDIQLNEINDHAQYLSKTIDTFKNFIKNDRDRIKVKINEQIYKVIALMESTLRNNYITLKLDLTAQNPEVELVEDELIQVMINIINNAKDAILYNKIEDAYIHIVSSTDKNNIIITIEDNAKGIEENILANIFEPYFTTKHKSQGTGLGLSMSHQIITKSFGGKLYAKNTQDGVKFVIEIPL